MLNDDLDQLRDIEGIDLDAEAQEELRKVVGYEEVFDPITHLPLCPKCKEPLDVVKLEEDMKPVWYCKDCDQEWRIIY